MSKLRFLFFAISITSSVAAQAEPYQIRATQALDRRAYYQLIEHKNRAQIFLDCSSIFQNLSVNGLSSKTYYLSEESCLQTAQYFTKPSWQKKCLTTFDNHFEYGDCVRGANR
jgi:hypothetical protein